MYEIIKDGVRLSLEDKLRYTKLQGNGVNCLCSFHEADGIVINNAHIVSLDGVIVKEFNGQDKLNRVMAAGMELAETAGEEPPATVGELSDVIPEWQPDTLYEKLYTLINYNGNVYFTRQAGLTSNSVYPPGTTGTEALYGVRPTPDHLGIYPYTYNMAATVGMRVQEGEAIYYCYNAIPVMVYPPSQLAAHFEIEAIE